MTKILLQGNAICYIQYEESCLSCTGNPTFCFISYIFIRSNRIIRSEKMKAKRNSMREEAFLVKLQVGIDFITN